MSLAERDEELSVLQDRLDEAACGSGNVTLLTGPVAVGKTAVLNLLAARAKASGARVLSAAASLSERCLPFGVIEQLCGPLMSAATAEQIAGLRLSGRYHNSISELDARAGSLQPSQVEAQVAHSLGTAVLALAEPAQVVISIDNAHCTDVPSLQCLLYIVRRLNSARIMIVCSCCSRPQTSHPFLLAELSRQPFCHRLRLAPLSVRGVSELLADHLDIETARLLASSCHEVSGGNPLLVRALIDDYRAVRHLAGKAGSPRPVLAAGFAHAVVDLLYRGERLTQQVAQAAAVLGDPAASGLLDRILSLALAFHTGGLAGRRV